MTEPKPSKPIRKARPEGLAFLAVAARSLLGPGLLTNRQHTGGVVTDHCQMCHGRVCITNQYAVSDQHAITDENTVTDQNALRVIESALGC